MGPALSCTGQQSPAVPPPLWARLSSANRGNRELLNLPHGPSFAIQVMLRILPAKQESPPGLLAAKQIRLGNRGAPMGLCLRKWGINHPAHRHMNMFVMYHILTSKQDASVVDGLLIPFAAQTIADTSLDSASFHCIRGHV